MITTAQKPTADVEYLSSAIMRDALINKFNDLFGREPVSMDVNAPLIVEDTRPPSMIQESVDPEIARLLKASAIEDAKNAEGEIPEPPNSTFLYSIVDDDPAEVAMEQVAEYQELDETARDATLSAVSDQLDINIEEGVAYVSGNASNIQIGIYADNEAFGQEFQYRLENAGGQELSPEEKVAVFDDLFEGLPGGTEDLDEGVRADLLQAVGLTSEVPEADKQTSPEQAAPGPEAMAETASVEKEAMEDVEEIDLGTAIFRLMNKGVQGWNAIAKSLKETFGLDESYLPQAEQEYLNMVSYASIDADAFDAHGRLVSVSSIVVSAKHDNRVFMVTAIVGDEKNPDFLIKDSLFGGTVLANKDDLTIY